MFGNHNHTKFFCDAVIVGN